MLSKIGFHTLLFSLLPILFLYQYNIHEIKPEHIVLPLLISAGIVALAWLILRFFVGRKSSLLVSWFLILFAVHGNLHIFLLTHENEFLQIFGKNLVLGPIFIVVLIVGIIYLIKTKSVSEKTSIANVMSITIVGFLLGSMLLYVIENPADLTASAYVDLPIITTEIEKKPDVYVFLLDENSGRELLTQDFNFDLTNIENEYEKRGFLVPKKSYSNYPHTTLSLPSILNMKYLDFLPEELGTDSKDRRLLYKITDQNNVMKIFKKNGYRLTSFYGGMGPTGDALLVDRKLCSFGTIDSDLRKNFVNTYIPVSYFNDYLLQRHEVEKLECFFSTILNFDEDEQRPDFVFAHLKLPHGPYIYNEKGERVNYPDPGRMEISLEKEAYRGQLIFTHTKMLELIDSIQTRSPDAIIMIISDHGLRAEVPDWENPTNIDFIRGFNVFTAYSFPGKEVILQTEISAVNTFRFFFNEYFDANYDILENRHIWHVGEQPYDWIEVSDNFKKLYFLLFFYENNIITIEN